jgi:hypothetical protein
LNNLKSACGGVIELKINNILQRRFVETPEIKTQTQFLKGTGFVICVT